MAKKAKAKSQKCRNWQRHKHDKTVAGTHSREDNTRTREQGVSKTVHKSLLILTWFGISEGGADEKGLCRDKNIAQLLLPLPATQSSSDRPSLKGYLVVCNLKPSLHGAILTRS